MRLDDVISKRTAIEVPFRYHLYCWFSHVVVAILDPILYPLGYCCDLDCHASFCRLGWAMRRRRAERIKEQQI